MNKCKTCANWEPRDNRETSFTGVCHALDVDTTGYISDAGGGDFHAITVALFGCVMWEQDQSAPALDKTSPSMVE